MKKERMKILGFLLLAIVMIVFLTNFISAESAMSQIADKFGLSGDQGIQDLKLFASRILLIALVALFVYAITSFLPFIPENSVGVKAGISIIIGILAFMFVSTADIQYILVNYEALGVMLTTVFPLIVLITVGTQLRLNPRTAGFASFINKILYIGFALYLVTRFLTLEPGNIENSTLIYVYPVTFLIILVWMIIEKYAVKTIRTGQRDADLETFDDNENRAQHVVVTRASSTRYHPPQGALGPGTG
jgi:hypothetical protein